MKKEDLVEGKWYSLQNCTTVTAMKFIKVKDERPYAIEWINNNNKYEKDNMKRNVGMEKLVSELDISKIQHLLPDGHPDKQPKELTFSIF